MRLNNKLKNIISAIFLIAALALVFVYRTRVDQIPQKTKVESNTAQVQVPVVQEKTVPQKTVEQNHFTLIINKQKLVINFKTNDILYNVLVTEQKKGEISMSGKIYSGMGFFVDQIGDLKDGTNGKHLIFYVNSEQAPVGVSTYRLKNNDTIEWKLN